MSTTPANWHPGPDGSLISCATGTATRGPNTSATTACSAIDPLKTEAGSTSSIGVMTSATRATRPRSSGSCTATAATAARNVGEAAFAGGGTIFTEPILVVNQKAKLIELNNQYSVFNQNGQQIAAVNQVGQTAAKKVMRLVSSLDQFMTHKLEITDPERPRAAAARPGPAR